LKYGGRSDKKSIQNTQHRVPYANESIAGWMRLQMRVDAAALRVLGRAIL
jgi:hypothetical protein